MTFNVLLFGFMFLGILYCAARDLPIGPGLASGRIAGAGFAIALVLNSLATREDEWLILGALVTGAAGIFLLDAGVKIANAHRPPPPPHD